MTLQRTRPVSYPPHKAPSAADIARRFNKKIRSVQGFRVALNANGNTSLSFTLNEPGRELLGISCVPVSGTSSDVGDCQIDLKVNNLLLLSSSALMSLVPNYVTNMLFFPTPQPLQGNDSFGGSVTKNDAGAVNVIFNLFYVPRR